MKLHRKFKYTRLCKTPFQIGLKQYRKSFISLNLLLKKLLSFAIRPRPSNKPQKVLIEFYSKFETKEYRKIRDSDRPTPQFPPPTHSAHTQTHRAP